MTYRNKQRLLFVIIGLLTVGILGSIAWLVWYDMKRGRSATTIGADGSDQLLNMSSRDREADINRTERAIQPNGFLGGYFARFERRAGRFPANLQDLFEKPPDLPASRWDGPYISTPDVLNDPWGQPYRYRCPGTYNQHGYDLWSVGPDGAEDTGDDIGNW